MDCIGFYGRKLYFGEGLVVQSPCNVSKYLEIEMPTEKMMSCMREMICPHSMTL